MSKRYDCRDPQERLAGIEAAVTAARAGELIVLPTDTVYGIGADAFIPAAVTTMLAAKGRGRNMPPPVLVGTARAAAALVDDLGAFGQDLIDEFWPGALTLVFRASPTLLWDLGDTKGTVALRMPLHSVALDVLKQTGPLAVSSANRHGQPSAISADEAEQQLSEAVSIYLDGGLTAGPLLFPGCPGILDESCWRTARFWSLMSGPVVSDEDFAAGPLLFPGLPGIPAHRSTGRSPPETGWSSP